MHLCSWCAAQLRVVAARAYCRTRDGVCLRLQGRTMGSRLSGAVCSRVRCLAGGSQRDGGAAGGGDHIVSCWLPSRSSMCVPG